MHSAGWKWLLAVVAVCTLAGCPGKPPVESKLEVAFDKPTEGQTLTSADDADPASDGFQYEVVATARDTAGRALKLERATLELRQAATEEWIPGPPAVIDGATARFPAAQLRVPATELRVSVVEQGSRRTATKTSTVQVNTTPPSVSLTVPTEGQLLNAAADADAATPGYQVRFTVQSSGLTGRTGTLRCEGACGLPETPFTVASGGTTEFLATLGTAACETEASCVAVVDDRGADVTSAARRFQVDSAPPQVNVTAPVVEALGPAGDASNAEGYQLRVSATTSADVGQDGVRLVLGPAGEAVSLTPVDGAVTHDFTVANTGEATYSLTFTATDDAGNTSTQTRDVIVDLVGLAITLETPAQGSTQEVQALGQGVPVRVLVTRGEQHTVRVFSKVGAAAENLVGELSVSGGVAEGAVGLPLGSQTVSAEVTDAVGNVTRDSSTDVLVRVASCAVALTAPAGESVRLLARDDRDPATAGLQYRLEGRAPGCLGRSVSLTRQGAPGAAPTTTVDSAGRFLFDVTLDDGASTRFTAAAVNVLGERSEDSVDVTVDITVPVLTAVIPAATTLFFVSANNANLFPVATPTPGYVADLEAGGDATADFQVTVSQAAGGSIQFFYRDQPVSAAVAVVEGAPTAVRVTLPHNTSGTLELRVTDPSGNEVRRAATATVDVVPPAPISVTRRELTNARAATVEVEWTASGDDGASGTPAGYDLRWTTNAQAPNGIDGYATFFNPQMAKQEGGALRPAGQTRATLTVPPLARYSIEVTARDELGNFAAFTPQPVAQQIRNLWRQVTLANPVLTAGGYQTYQSGRGDLNGDGRQDLVVGAATTASIGSAYVYYGAADLVAQPPLRQTVDTTGNTGQFFATDFDLGDVGNATVDDRVDDLAIGARAWSDPAGASGRGRVFLYLGRRGQVLDLADALEIRGTRGVSGNFGGTVKMISDLNGDGLRELAIAAHNESPGRVFIFFGRSRDAWRALLREDLDTTQTCSSGVGCIIPAALADVKISGDAGMAFFGRTRGYARMGDVTGDGVPDFAIPGSNDRVNRVWLFSGAQATSGANLNLTHAFTSVTGLAVSTPTGANSGFGAEAVGDVNLVGGSTADLLVTQPKLDRMFLFRDGNFSAAPTIFNGTGQFGSAVRAGDLNGDGRPDLIIGQNRTPSSAYFFFSKGGEADEFDVTQGVGFAQSMLEPLGMQGITVGVLDFNGDGLLDVSVGDIATNGGQVVVYY
ncbi:FG-GAP-like repeat-containing protein [Pyxidicoccus xibeiensis]|uniref:FG-GAP-like repeat-containing protein n=1 Tax=Pyxidicoccus xibeiensis TaxID=2906759 RepID=UPI0020A7D8F6|nr:FG-GAP-like repeat-containing protein [Pyxidicoccus xibeiensis]MCP3144284.1 FG-GAP-like repeat-containing protein [Pyxidicoccus xibeiensis]